MNEQQPKITIANDKFVVVDNKVYELRGSVVNQMPKAGGNSPTTGDFLMMMVITGFLAFIYFEGWKFF